MLTVASLIEAWAENWVTSQIQRDETVLSFSCIPYRYVSGIGAQRCEPKDADFWRGFLAVLNEEDDIVFDFFVEDFKTREDAEACMAFALKVAMR